MARDDDRRSGEDVREDVMSAPESPADVHKDRRYHGGIPPRLDDEELVERTEEERVEAGVDAYDPDDVPPATDDPVPVDITETEEYQEEKAEVDREVAEGLLPSGQRPVVFPPSHYPDK
jgi:hypothetical protein